MGENGSLRDVETLLASLEETRHDVTRDIDDGLRRGGQLREASRVVGYSSSASWLGWHSRMYYGDYEGPPVVESWDPEWGGIHSFSDHWRERSQADVQEAVERRADETLAELAATADHVRERCEALQREVLTVLSPICDLAGLEKEAELLSKLENIEWIFPPGNFIRALAPRGVMSRDSTALSQACRRLSISTLRRRSSPTPRPSGTQETS